ncbi:MAG: hypothetical protein ACTSPM_12785 [Candidatus Heimdallarchaeota archaeon]
MSTQKVFGLIVTNQKIPLLEKPDEKDQCYLCGFTFGEEDCVLIITNEDQKITPKMFTESFTIIIQRY